MLRKHVKVEPLRWYAPLRPARHAGLAGRRQRRRPLPHGRRDLAGTVPDPAARHPVALGDGRGDEAGRALFREELRGPSSTCATSRRSPCWVPFNEGWGQFDAAAVAAEVAALDPTRIVDHASGWHDQGGGDLRSLHVYGRRFRLPRRPRPPGRRADRVRRPQPARRGPRVRRRGRLRLRPRGQPPRTWPRRSRGCTNGSRSTYPAGWRPPSTPSCPTSRTSSTAC